LRERTDAAPCHQTELPRLVTSETHLLAFAGGSGFVARIHARRGNQKQMKQLGFNRILDPYSIGTENAQNIL
jgi:hypothetical protein